MGRLVTRAAAVVVAAGAMAGALGVAGVAAAGAASWAPQQAPQPARAPSLATAHGLATPGAKLWVRRFSGPGKDSDVASSVAASPGGGTVFVTGDSTDTSFNSDYLTVAYNAATGARLWTARYNGPGNSIDNARAVAVSPDGATVFVTGDSVGGPESGHSDDYATVAYRASDGTQLWVARFNGSTDSGDFAAAVSVARDGTAVFVTGTSFLGGFDSVSSMTTVAFRASDGAQLWVKNWKPASCCNYGGTAIVSPGGNRVFVTGLVQSAAVTAEYGTVAYNATTGARLWARRYTGQGATSIAVSPDLAKVYVTGESHFNYGTLAYSARTGTRLWARFYGARRSTEFANSVAVSPSGTVLVTGGTRGRSGLNTDYATVAYSPGGAQLWARRYSGPGNHSDIASAVAVPGNGRVYVTGTSWGGSATRDDYATIAYNVRTGARVWVRRYNGPASGADSASSLAARGGRVFVTGGSAGTTSGDDYATIAYRG
jgi:outer membrane protein assembly factor BamB